MIASLHERGYHGVRKEEMAAEGEVRASHEEVEGFVTKLRDFHGSLDESEQAMLGAILGSAQGADTTAYGFRNAYADWGREGDQEQDRQQGWNDLVGWIEEQGEEDTQGFLYRFR